MKLNKSIFIWSICTITAIIACIAYFHNKQFYPRTEDAYIHADIIQVGALVTGPVSQVHVAEHSQVKKDQLLFEIDPTPYQIALNQAKANLDVIKQKINAGKRSIEAVESTVKKTEAEAIRQKKQTARILSLMKQNLSSQAEADQATTLLAAAKANLAQTKSKLLEAKLQLGALDNTNAQTRLAQATVDSAERNLRLTKIYAPIDGQLQKFKIRKSQIINQNQPLFALIENGTTWISANFKETDLTRIKVGQSATIKIDMYPSKTFQGKVATISRGSGSAFSLLPAENASGNWVKITQRFPVRISIANIDDTHFPLRVGASCKVTINTK